MVEAQRMSTEKKHVKDWTRKELLALPHRGWADDIGMFDSLVIVPTRRKHDSGYSCMEIIAVRDGVPFIRLAGHSDVVHIDGIGGPTAWKYSPRRAGACITAWSMDCLPRSQCLQLFPETLHTLVCGPSLSSFEVWAVLRPAEQATT